MSGDSYTVAVRELCEFAAKSGDLDHRFTPSPSAEEGMQGHRTVASRRGPGHRTEVPVHGRFDQLQVRGRVDGYDATEQLLEEVKTFKGELARMPANQRALHWAQAKVYAWLVCQQFGLAQLQVSLVYFDIRSETETALQQRCSANELRDFFESLCSRFLNWARRQLAHRAARDSRLQALAFPHIEFRGGQRSLAAQVFHAMRSGRCLMAQAPTGIGKTLGTLFPTLKAAPGQKLDKVFFLSAKTAGRAVALQAIELLRQHEPSFPLRVLELVARETVCEHPTKACHGDACPLAAGFYDRLPAARDDAAAMPMLTRAALREVARLHRVCPYYLSQEMVRWADVVVGDYNHYFDCSGAFFHTLTVVNEWQVAVLVDEAHNLIERARSMYSATLEERDLQAAIAAAPAELKPALRQLLRAWHRLLARQDVAYKAYAQPVENIVAALRDAAAAIAEFCADKPLAADDALLRFYFDALHFARLAESFAKHSLFDVNVRPPTLGAASMQRSASTLCIRNVVPAPFLKARFAAARASVLFSATLCPAQFYADALGLPESSAWLDVDGTFDAEQLEVRIVDDVSTRYLQRNGSLQPIAALLAAQYAERPGNYLAFFSSFDYLDAALREFSARHPDVPVWRQTPRMSESERHGFLARFTPDGTGIAFAVLGGSFGEGIDLPGTRLIGAFIATLGMPQFNAVNEQMKTSIDAMFGAGFEYTYLYPGIRRVVQAAGRVIRSPSDRGSLLLIDDRFARPDVIALLPKWWRIERGRRAAGRPLGPGADGQPVPELTTRRPTKRAEGRRPGVAQEDR